jgi:hypothetical protein
VLGPAGWGALYRGKRGGIGDDDRHRAGVVRQAQQFETESPRARVHDCIAGQFRGNRLGVLGVVAEVVIDERGPDVEARHPH